MRAMVRAGIPGYARWITADTAKAGAFTGATMSSTVSADFDFGEYGPADFRDYNPADFAIPVELPDNG